MKCKVCGEELAIILVGDKEVGYCFNCGNKLDNNFKENKDAKYK